MISTGDLLLARVACSQGDAARDAWIEWRSQVPLDDVSYACAALLAGLARRPELLVDDPDAGRLRGMARHCWASNNVLWGRVAPVLQALSKQGLSFAPLREAGLQAHSSRSEMHRLDVIDLLVPTREVRVTERVLSRLGWHPGAVWSDGEGGRIGIHDRAVPASRSTRADARVWLAAGPAPVGQSLQPVHLALHHLVTGETDVRWLVGLHRLLSLPGVAAELPLWLRAYGVVSASRPRLAMLNLLGGAPAVDCHRGSLDLVRAAVPRCGRAGRAAEQLLDHAGGVGLHRAAASLLHERLDLDRSARPAATSVHALLGRSPLVARQLRRGGPLTRGRPGSPALRPGDVVDLTDDAVARHHCGTGWWPPGPQGIASRSNEGRLWLRLAEPGRLALVLHADQDLPVVVTVQDREAAQTPGRGGPAEVVLEAPAGDVEIALRSSARRCAWPAPLFVVVRGVEVRPCA